METNIASPIFSYLVSIPLLTIMGLVLYIQYKEQMVKYNNKKRRN